MSLTAPSFEAATRRIDPFLMSVLKSRFEAIVREMALVVLRTSRSAVIKNARDFSCAILTYDHQLVSVEDALPIHVMSMDMATRPLNELFDDVAQGDIFINNCPYTLSLASSKTMRQAQRRQKQSKRLRNRSNSFTALRVP